MAFVDELFEGLLPAPTAKLPKGMELNCVEDPAAEPCTVAELKDVMRYPQSLTNQDAHMLRLLKSSRRTIEAMTRTLMITQTWEQIQNAASRQIEVARKPVQSIDKIEIVPNFDSDTRVTVATNLYITTGVNATPTQGRPPKGILLARSTWPVSRGWKGFIITFTGGFGDDAADVPSDLIQAVYALAAHRFENPDGEQSETSATATQIYGAVPPSVRLMVEDYLEWR